MKEDTNVIKAWVTKRALTEGIEEVTGEVCDNMLWYGGSNHAHGKDWHRTREEAVLQAEEMRLKKIASMKKKLAKLERMRFE